MNIEFSDFSDLETVAIQLDETLNLLSILGENVFYDDEFMLSPYKAQFVSVNNAAINEIRHHKKTIQNIFNVLYAKFQQEKSSETNDK